MVINFLMLSTLLHKEDGTVILLQDKSGDLSKKNWMWKNEANNLFPHCSSIE